MKRSEMVEKIAEELLQSRIYGGDTEEREAARMSTKMQRLRFANEALKAVEKFGMPAPAYLDLRYIESWIHEWEPEDWK